jgi:2-dehydro-3-deoxyphosphogluconate aldolase/(4S)-4-hydroxy-2-oxoglutarate aldolase
MNELFSNTLKDVPVLGILRGMSIEQTIERVRWADDVGIRMVEVPLQSRESAAALEAAVAVGRATGVLVGSGTALTAGDVRDARTIGASFIVSPGFDDDVAAECRRWDLPHLPGVSTATEVHRAMKAGLTVQKLFPAATVGPQWIEAMRGPFPTVSFVATGGINENNAEQFLNAGALAVAFGSNITRVRHLPTRSR